MMGGKKEKKGTQEDSFLGLLDTDQISSYFHNIQTPFRYKGVGLGSWGEIEPLYFCLVEIEQFLGYPLPGFVIGWLWGARSGGVEPTAQGGRMKLTGRASCLLTHRWIFASAPGLQSNKKPLINSSPAAQQTSSRAFRIWLTAVKQGAF
eukprot:bmy_12723T0